MCELRLAILHTMNLNLLLLILCCLPIPSSHAAIAKPGCIDSCGGVTIPYPFGIGPNCYHDPWFEITCSTNSSDIDQARRRPLLTKFNIEVLNISYDYNPMLTVGIPPFNICSSNAPQTSQTFTSINLRGSPYGFSTDWNVFTMRGCPGSSVLRRKKDNKVTAGCATICRSNGVENVTSGCYGVNCCQSPLTTGAEEQDDFLASGEGLMQNYKVQFNNNNNLTEDTTNPQQCLVATLVQKSSVTSPFPSNSSTSLYPVLLDWIFLSTDLPQCSRGFRGSRCSCPFPYEGNPYLPNGCQGLSTGVGIVLLVACCYWMYRVVKKQLVMKKKAKYFKQNGGLLLQQQLSSRDGALEKAKVFTSDELEKATEQFSQDRILGQGGQGTVYKGMLTDGKIVAIKKSKQVDETQLSQFINEVVILSQINHRHVVNVLGCCLESKVPLLVYEFIPNGTLAEHIHDLDEDHHLTWKMRLQIASQSAGAIAYLHSSSSPPIYHRDIKSSNILLDEKNRAKVADFGSSKTIAIDQTHLTTVVQGTMGYLDPEYFQTYQFTDRFPRPSSVGGG